jgi:hypothetical protein
MLLLEAKFESVSNWPETDNPERNAKSGISQKKKRFNQPKGDIKRKAMKRLE